MTTTKQPPVSALDSLRRARELFLLGRQLPDGLPDDVVAAWKRARFFGVRHDAPGGVEGPEPDSLDPRDSPGPSAGPDGPALLNAARPVLERIAQALGAERTTLVLTDERLRVLWASEATGATGYAADVRCVRNLSEQLVGPNSAARALHTRRRAEAHGPEHFLDLWQDVSAVSVPVLAPETGRTLGTVTVLSELSPERRPHPGASLAEAAASAVEAALLARAQPAERVLLDTYLRAVRDRGQAVVAVDGRNRLVSEAAGRLLSPQALETLERSAAALLRDGTPWTAYAVRLPDGAGCSATVRPVTHLGSITGAVAVLEPLGPPTPQTATHPERAAVTLAGRSVPWFHAVDRVTDLSRSPEPLLLVGERGTGKTSLARELVREEPLTVDAAEGELTAAADALTGGRILLIRHVERLTQPDAALLNSLLGARPGPPLLLTYTPGAPVGPCLQRLLDTLAARSVTLPALRERPEDIRELLTALTPSPTPGRPPLTWTLDALRALEQHPWPGNVTELAHLVRSLAEHRRATGPVRRDELPDPVREGPAGRHLSPMEHAERTAILEALSRHGGNKTHTAAALGIARATLYRKLRGYQEKR